MFLRLNDEKSQVAEARFDGQGCALMTASADILCEAVQGKTSDDLRKFSAEDLLQIYGEAPSPGRLKCLLLPYEALKSATTLL